MKLRMYLLLGTLLLACSACGTAGRQTAGETKVLTQEEVAATGATYANAYEMVRMLRPQWLRKRGRGEQGDVVVYVNDVRMGGPDALRDLDAASIATMHFLDAAEAVRYGSGHQHGVIQVQTR